MGVLFFFFFFQAEDGIRYFHVTGVQTCALPISLGVAAEDLRRLFAAVAVVDQGRSERWPAFVAGEDPCAGPDPIYVRRAGRLHGAMVKGIALAGILSASRAA